MKCFEQYLLCYIKLNCLNLLLTSLSRRPGERTCFLSLQRWIAQLCFNWDVLKVHMQFFFRNHHNDNLHFAFVSTVAQLFGSTFNYKNIYYASVIYLVYYASVIQLLFGTVITVQIPPNQCVQSAFYLHPVYSFIFLYLHPIYYLCAEV